MRGLAIALFVVPLLGEVPGSVEAQTAADTLAVEVAVARHERDQVSAGTRLESRVALPSVKNPAPPERPRAGAIARALGVPLAHEGSYLHRCGDSCDQGPVRSVIVISQPWIQGDSAQVTVGYLQRLSAKHFGRTVRTFALKHIAGRWQVVGTAVIGVS